ncbi:hypothetical protein [Rhodospirillum rubrum]|uniref:hypothetical protein n=2 Tax=Rhodospirillum rubrum TaxID=1085 RepID=UPI001A929499|nr:hypothetical protein [Rhodospirillum rubrum]
MVLVPLLAGCQTDTLQQQTAALTLAPESMAQRQMQLRRFDTRDEAAMLSTTASVLQDLGFIIEESAAKSGLIVATKDRDAVEGQQVAGQIFLAMLITAMGGVADPQWDHVQKIRLSVVTKPSADAASMVVRITFQRIVWNNKNQISRVETINDPLVYQKFFDQLAEAAFLEAHQI